MNYLDRKMVMPLFEKTSLNKVKRHPERAAYEKDVIYQIIDEAIICHVGFVQDNRPYVIPTLHARRDNDILLHGATTSRMIKHIAAGNEVCLTMTLLDGLVLARSVFNHSANYRSAVLFGRGRLIEQKEEVLQALKAFTESMIPGRWDDVRQPNDKELKATSIVSIPIDLASAKIRQGPPGDEEADLDLPVWAGVVPVRQQMGEPVNAPDLKEGIPVPDYLRRYIGNQGR
jgi:nitroimidazol reductase NimA-like FMN-containing flavoprotein (pyridoxamine 5'-phosphate oxidase superfamily)